MKLSLGPVLFYWDRQQTLDFYADMADMPLDVIYLGETVCSKRRDMGLDDWIGLARELKQQSAAQLVLSGLALVEAASELSSLRRLCENGELMVEANDTSLSTAPSRRMTMRSAVHSHSQIWNSSVQPGPKSDTGQWDESHEGVHRVSVPHAKLAKMLPP